MASGLAAAYRLGSGQWHLVIAGTPAVGQMPANNADGARADGDRMHATGVPTGAQTGIMQGGSCADRCIDKLRRPSRNPPQRRNSPPAALSDTVIDLDCVSLMDADTGVQATPNGDTAGSAAI